MEETVQHTGSKSYWRFLGITFFVLLLMFAVSEALGLHLLESTDQMKEWTLPVAATVGVLLLIADVFLPVPSSMIMVAHGTLFGFAGGAALSLVGGVGAAMMGYWLGKVGKGLLHRWFRPQDFAVGDRFFGKWGMSSVIVSRPIPLIAETISIAAGTAKMPWQRMLLASVLGTLPTALAYAWAGAYLKTYDAGLWAFLAVVGVAGVFVALGYFIQHRKQSRATR